MPFDGRRREEGTRGGRQHQSAKREMHNEGGGWTRQDEPRKNGNSIVGRDRQAMQRQKPRRGGGRLVGNYKNA